MALFEEQDTSPAERWRYGSDIEAVEARTPSKVLNSVYRHMALGLGVTGLSALYVASRPELADIAREYRLGLIVVQLGLVFGLSLLLNSLSAAAAGFMFYAYALVTGVTLSLLFEIYARGSIANAFFVTAGTFGAMSAYGYVTKRDLTRIGSLLFMALLGLIIASVVNMFVQSSTIMKLTTYAGVLIFVGLTAYDTQRIKRMAFGTSEAKADKVAILGALILYLDFINLFLNLLRLMGSRRR